MKKLYTVLLCLFFAVVGGVGVYSLLDGDQVVSAAENRALAQPPELSLYSVLYQDYTTDFETYYADQFPLRESLRSCNRALNRFYYYSGSGSDNILLIDYQSQAEQGGEAITSYKSSTSAPADAPSGGQAASDTSPSEPQTADAPVYILDLSHPQEQAADTNAAVQTESAESAEQTEPAESAEQTEQIEQTEQAEASAGQTDKDQQEMFQSGSILIHGDRAMDVPYATYSLVEDYAGVISSMARTLGSDVRVFSLLTPNAAAFYAPESFRQGNYNQQSMIDYCYSQMQGVTTIDAYTALSAHTDEYIYFRTDHHWTALGAYYAYRALCQAAGFPVVELSAFETGRYEGFVGSLYGYTSQYPQSQALLDNPDYLDYYLPLTACTCTYYDNAEMTGGGSLPVVSTSLSDSVSNKYLCFVGGDFPLEVIQTGAEGPVCVMIKESYGNAMVPFLTSHYSRIYLIDPREFNRGEGYPTLNLSEFVSRVGADDVIVLNYPFMVTNKSYITWLDYLIHTPQTAEDPA